MKKIPPVDLGSGKVVQYTTFDEHVSSTGKTRHIIGSTVMGMPAGLAIVQYSER